MELLEKLKQMALSNETHIKITLGSIIALTLFAVSGTYWFTTNLSELKNADKNNTELILYNSEDISDIVTVVDQNSQTNRLQEVKQAEIMVQLANIKDRQIEMIQILKEMN